MTSKTRIETWQSLTLNEDSSFANALSVMSEGGYQLALVENKGFLTGMVTDSDIRKALLRGVKVNQSITKVMNRKPLIASPKMGESEAQQLMLINNFFHLPIVDSEGRLIGLHVAEQLRRPSKRSETLVVMAGGKGKRLMPLTADHPKPMLPVNGKPILEHIIERARKEGFVKIVICVNYLSEQITSYFSDGKKFDLNIDYIHEQQPLGTAGALSLLKKSHQNYPIVVTNGDVISDVSYVDILNQAYRDHADGVMAVRNQEWTNPFGVVFSEENKLTGIEEKPTYRHQVNAGIYVLKSTLLNKLISEKYCDMTELFHRGMVEGLNLRVFPLHESWVDIGRPDDYKQAGGTVE